MLAGRVHHCNAAAQCNAERYLARFRPALAWSRPSSGGEFKGCAWAGRCAGIWLTLFIAGTYTLIASTFLPGQECDCRLRVESSLPVSVSPLPQEGAGLFSRTGKGAWCV